MLSIIFSTCEKFGFLSLSDKVLLLKADDNVSIFTVMDNVCNRTFLKENLEAFIQIVKPNEFQIIHISMACSPKNKRHNILFCVGNPKTVASL